MSQIRRIDKTVYSPGKHVLDRSKPAQIDTPKALCTHSGNKKLMKAKGMKAAWPSIKDPLWENATWRSISMDREGGRKLRLPASGLLAGD